MSDTNYVLDISEHSQIEQKVKSKYIINILEKGKSFIS